MSHPHRKYDPSLLQELAQRPKSKGGRPRKFTTPEQKRAADAEYHRIAYQRAKLLALGEPLPEELKPKKPRKYATDEERALARKEYTAEYERSHRAARNLIKMISLTRAKLP